MTQEQYTGQVDQFQSTLNSLIKKHGLIYRKQAELRKEEEIVSSEIEKLEKAMALFRSMYGPLFSIDSSALSKA